MREWNMYYLQKAHGKIISRYVGKMKARSARAAELALHHKVPEVSADQLVARDPKHDQWQPPVNRK